MAGDELRMALIDNINPLAEAIERLREIGFRDEEITVYSGQPHTTVALGRPLLKTHVPYIGMTGFLVGLGMAVALVWGTPLQYPLSVGGQPIRPIPPLLVLGFEFSMLGLMVGTFLGVVWESRFPAFGSKIYHPEISDGKTAVVFECPPDEYEDTKQKLADLGVTWIDPVEEMTL